MVFDKDPTENISIVFDTGVIEFNPKCQRQPTFEKMIRKGGLDRLPECSILIEVLKRSDEGQKQGYCGGHEEIPRVSGYGWGWYGSSKAVVEVGSEEGSQVEPSFLVIEPKPSVRFLASCNPSQLLDASFRSSTMLLPR